MNLIVWWKIVSEQRQRNKDITFLCDPVMGDNGALYVPEELVSIYKKSIVGLSDVLTPNQTELELLTDMAVTSEEDVLKACQLLHAKGPHTVVSLYKYGELQIVHQSGTATKWG